MVSPISFLIIFAATWLNALGSMNLKIASNNLKNNIFKILTNKNLILGFVFFGLSTLMYLVILKDENLSIIYPLTSMSYIWVATISHYKFGESMHAKKLAGIALIMLGIVLINI